jgi:hypothetical protein
VGGCWATKSIGTIGVEVKVNQVIPVVDLDLQLPKHGEAQGSGNLGAHRLANVLQIKGDEIVATLLEMSEPQGDFPGGVHISYLAAQTFYSVVVFPLYFGDFAGGSRSNGVVPSSGI